MGPAVHILATSHPQTMRSLLGIRAVGATATAFADLLTGTVELTTADVHEHAELRATSVSILGEDTHAVAIVPVRADHEVVGFLRLDAPRAGSIDRGAIERLHELSPMASLAIQLEHQRVRSQAHITRVQELRAAMCRHTVREREAGLELQQAARVLRDMVESVAPKLAQAERLELGALVRKCTEYVEVAADVLADADRGTPREGMQPAAVEPN